jgi:hypothetical protein
LTQSPILLHQALKLAMRYFEDHLVFPKRLSLR